MKWIELLWRLDDRRDALAWFDWASGLVRIETSKSEFDQALERSQSEPNISPGDEDIQLVRSLTHEHVHLLQAVTTGYLYRWDVQFSALLSAAAEQLLAKVGSDVAFPRVLREAPSNLRPEILGELHNHLSLLDTPGPYGLTVRNIFEAHALIIELMVHHELFNADTVLALLAETAPQTDDRLAFDLARFWLGERPALLVFPAFAAAALCTTDPPRYFAEFLQLGTQRLDLEAGRLEARAVVEVLNEVAGPELIGTAAEELIRSPNSRHPTLTGIVKTLIELDFQFGDLLVDPERALESVAKEIIQPTLFRADEDGRFTLVVPPDQTLESAEPALLLAALSASLGPTIASEASLRLAETGLSWLAVRTGGIKVLRIPSPFQEAADNLVAALGDSERAPELWGSCTLAFDLPEEVLTPRDPQVRAFVGYLSSRIPHFPLFLNFEEELLMAWVWFGATAPESAWHGAGLDIADPSVTQGVMDAVDSMQSAALALGLRAQPQVDRLLAAMNLRL